MSSIRKFMFDVSFDPDTPESDRRRKDKAAAEPPPPPPPPTFNVAELEQARAKAYAEGLAQGNAEGEARGRAAVESDLQAALVGAMIQVAEGVERLLAERDALNAERTGQPMHIAMAVLGKLLPALVRREGKAELEAFVSGCVAEAIDEPRLTIHAHPEVMAGLREMVEELATLRGFTGRLVMLEDAGLGLSDARVEWAEGGAERNTAQLLAVIEEAAERMLGTG